MATPLRAGTRVRVTDQRPTMQDPIVELLLDKEATVHVEQVLEYNQDPTSLRDLLLYRLNCDVDLIVRTRTA